MAIHTATALRAEKGYFYVIEILYPIYFIPLICNLSRYISTNLIQKQTVQPAPFVKPHCVLIVATATVLLMKWRSAHQEWSWSILMQA